MHIERFVLPRQHLLAPLVQSIFLVRDPRPRHRHEVVMPTGRVDLLINLGDALVASRPGDRVVIGSGRATLSGLRTTAFRSTPTGALHLLGISLRAESAGAVLHGAQAEIADQHVDAPAVVRGIEPVLLAAAEAPSFAASCDHLLRWVARRQHVDDRAALVRRACAALRREPTHARLATLAAELAISPRHLHRVMRAHLGVAPSTYARISRFARALDLMGTLPRLTDVAHAAHYADQPHLCRDFKTLTGLTPDEYRRGDVPAPGHLFA